MTAKPTIEHQYQLEAAEVASAVELSHDGSRIAIASERSVVVYDSGTRQQLARWSCRATISDISISSDGSLVAVALNHSTIDVYAVNTGAVTSRLDRAGGPDFLRDDPQQHLAFYPGETKLVSTGAKRRMYVSDVVSGKWDYIMFVKYGSRCDCAVSPDGNHVVLFGQQNRGELSGHVTMYRVNHGLQPLWTKWHDGDGNIRCGVFSSDSNLLATCGANDGIRIWDVKSGELAKHLQRANEPISVALCGKNHVVSACPSQIEVIQIDTGRPTQVLEFDHPFRGLSCSADCSVLATYGSGSVVDVWRVNHGSE